VCCQLKEHILNNGYGFANEFIRNLNDVFSEPVIVSYSSNLSSITEIALQISGGLYLEKRKKTFLAISPFSNVPYLII
jgi:hypothetical protein